MSLLLTIFPSPTQPDCTEPGFTYCGCVDIALSLDDDLVKQVRKMAVEREATRTRADLHVLLP